MSRTHNKWATGIKRKNKKGLTTGWASSLNGHVSRKNRLDRKLQIVANGGMINCHVVMCGDTPAYKWGKPIRHDCSDRNHLMQKTMKRNFRRFLQEEERQLIHDALSENEQTFAN